jgi:aminoglycoside/choline kinase family phosphotransferase
MQVIKKQEIMDEEIQKFLNDNLGTASRELIPIKKGGSDRSFFRVCLPDQSSFIFMHYGTDVEENSHWADINRFLAGLDISVPRILAQDLHLHFLLLEDLGDVDLWSQRNLPWDRRRDYYFQVLRQIRRLHSFELSRIPSRLKLTEGYGEKLYRWEHHYFQENFVEEVCQLSICHSLQKKLEQELGGLITRLQKIEPCLIHRDFQSQNILIKNNRPVLIDFQGMRKGCLFYDLGSLICDPYVTFSDRERDELITFYYELMQPNYGRNEFIINFWEASTQRLMQALGAYGFLGLKKKKPDFLRHINNGITNLLIATTYAATLPVLHELAGECIQKLSKEKP